MPRSLVQPAIAVAIEADAEPGKVVECGFCHVSGLSSQIPAIAGLRRCTEIDECVQREIKYATSGGQPRPLINFSATPEPLPKREPAPAGSTAEPLPEPEEEPLPELPPVQEAALVAFNRDHDEQDAAEKAAGEPEAAGPAEPGTEDEEPAQDSAPVPVAEPEPASPVAEDSAPAEDTEGAG
jgi:hypothetical protein